jgi:archaetidylinositol phosphate synthase
MIKEKSKVWAKISSNLGYAFSHLPFRPDHYTWLTLPAAFFGLLAIIYGHVVIGIILFIIAGVLDLIDGAVARYTNQSSQSGAFLDGSLDRFIDFFLIFSYFWLPLHTPWQPVSHWISIAIFLAIMPSFEVAYANHRGAVVDPDEKLIWRILNRGEMYTLMLLVPLIAIWSANWAGYCLIVLVVLSAITTLQTLFSTLYHAKKYSG